MPPTQPNPNPNPKPNPKPKPTPNPNPNPQPKPKPNPSPGLLETARRRAAERAVLAPLERLQLQRQPRGLRLQASLGVPPQLAADPPLQVRVRARVRVRAP